MEKSILVASVSTFVRKINAVSSSEADFSKEFLIKMLIVATKTFFSKNRSVISKFCFLQIFLMVLAYSELGGLVHMTKIEKQVTFWNYLIFGGFGASQRSY